MLVSDYSWVAACAVLGYAAVHFNKVHVDRGLVLKALALYSLVNTAVNLVTRKGFGEKVGPLRNGGLFNLSLRADGDRMCEPLRGAIPVSNPQQTTMQGPCTTAMYSHGCSAVISLEQLL